MKKFRLGTESLYNSDIAVVKALTYAGGKADVAERLDLAQEWTKDARIKSDVREAIINFILDVEEREGVSDQFACYEKADDIYELEISSTGNTYYVSVGFYLESDDEWDSDREKEGNSYYISKRETIDIFDELFKDIISFRKEIITLSKFYHELTDEEKDKVYIIFLNGLELMDEFKKTMNEERDALIEKYCTPYKEMTGCGFTISYSLGRIELDEDYIYKIDNVYIHHDQVDFDKLKEYIADERKNRNIYVPDIERIYHHIMNDVKRIVSNMEYHLNLKLNSLSSRKIFERRCEEGSFKFLKENDFEIIRIGSLIEKEEEPNLFNAGCR